MSHTRHGNLHESLEECLGRLPESFYDIPSEVLLELMVEFCSMSVGEVEEEVLRIKSALSEDEVEKLVGLPEAH